MKHSRIPVDVGPPAARHTIQGMRHADKPVGSVELLMHRLVKLDRWNLRSAADAYWRLYWPLSRGGEVILHGRVHPLDPGSLYLISPHTVFDSRCLRPFAKWYIHFTIGGIFAHCRPDLLRIQPGGPMRRLAGRVFPARTPARGAVGPVTPQLEAVDLVVQVLGVAAAHFRPPPDSDPRLPRCTAYLCEHMMKKVTLRELARFAGISERTLSSLFQSATGFPPMRYLIELRLNHAMKLLRHTNQTIEQVATECGFANRYYFTRMFTKYRQVAPATFRAQVKQT